uniref:glycylpeptide N-tetradecanoyltransferase n=1 Tax=Gongylonema pulchrum TaxID=637853 RepID=A0A183E022_9BILA
LKAPGWMKHWHCGVRAKTSGKLVAFISAIPSVIRVYDKVIKMVEINFLCVHKKLRSKRVAPVLIREITRRVNRQGIFQAAFTAGVQPKTSNLMPMEKCHIDSAYKLLQNYLKKFDLAPVFSRADFEHFFLPRYNVIYSYVALVRLPSQQFH